MENDSTQGIPEPTALPLGQTTPVRTFDDIQAALLPLAIEVLEECRTSLMMSHRFLNVALWHMPFTSGSPAQTLATDGNQLYFEPFSLLVRFNENPSEATRDMLHSLLHCVFRQPFDETHTDTQSWDLVCDIIVERLAMDMAGERYKTRRDKKRIEAYEKLEREHGRMKAEELYQLFAASFEQQKNPVRRAMNAPKLLNLNELRELQMLFLRDDHMPWHMGKDMSKPDKEAPDEPEDSEPQPDQDHEQQSEQKTKEEWEQIAKEVQAELEQLKEDTPGTKSMLVDLSRANAQKYNYRDFLRRFAAMHEDMIINDDEFDYIFYTYGLNHYGNMPLVEPLEYKETQKVREFVVALDTSGSVQGHLLENFIRRTCEILCESETFGTKVNIHLIQCDSKIQEDTVIHDLSEMDAYLESFRVKGMGGTDFRPVFDYVAALQSEGELNNLKGLIYFTDGLGTFPQQPTQYETAFVFLEHTDVINDVPPWAMRVVLGTEQLVQL